MVLLGIIAIVLAIFVVQSIADAYTNYLWYQSIHETMLWRSMVETKLGLGAVFAGSFFLACWGSLWAVDALSPVDIYAVPEHELVRRYHATLGRYRITVRTVVSLLLAIAVGIGTSSQWQHWLLFLNGGTFGLKDPQFQKDVGFYVFRLPFLSFLVDWSLVALIVLFLVTALAHFLNGGLRTTGPSPRIDGHVVAHLSLILALMAIVRAAGYFFVDRYALDLSNNGLVTGAGYTDVHVRLPALSVLAVVAMLGFVLLSVNVYHRTVVLPIVAVGLWAFVALLLGVVFPAFVQWLQVQGSQNTLELPYVERNISFTRYAFGLSSVKPQRFGAHADLQASAVDANHASLDDLPLWDPSVSAATYSDLQGLRGYYKLSGLSLDRYVIGSGPNRALTPVVVGARQINPAGQQNKTWVSQHLEYTHGYGAIVSPANSATSAGLPNFAVSEVPVKSAKGAPTLTQPDVYYGDSPSSYAVVDTRQPELDYVPNGGSAVAHTSHYSGSGGISLRGFWQRAAFAMKFHDVNLLTSGLLTKSSKIMYLQDVEQRVQHAAPFLKVDSRPYPVIAGGKLFWMVDCYTSSSSFPYSEDALTGLLPADSGLQGQYNYLRDSVKAVVDAYTGAVKFFVADPSDPLIIAWEHTYPGMFLPMKDMTALTPGSSATLLQHLRYPQQMLTVETAMYGRYHFLPTASGAGQFISGQNAWDVAANSDGSVYTPAYELLTLPGQLSPSFVAVEPFVPYSPNGQTQLLAGFMTGQSDWPGYGALTAYELPKISSSALGPAPVAAKIAENPNVAKLLSLLDANHSKVIVGLTLLVPIEDSLVYVQPLYVSSTERALPALEYVATDFAGQNVGLSTTLLGSLRELFGGSVTGIGPPSSQPIFLRIQQDLNLAYAAYERSVYAGKHFQLGALQRDLQEMGQYLQQAHALEQAQASSSSSSGSSSHGTSANAGSGKAGSGSSSTTSHPSSTSGVPTPSGSSSSATGLTENPSSSTPSGIGASAEAASRSASTTTTTSPRMG